MYIYIYLNIFKYIYKYIYVIIYNSAKIDNIEPPKKLLHWTLDDYVARKDRRQTPQ